VITSKVTSKGQVTIPAEIREKLGLREGDVLVYEFDEQTARVLVSKLQPFDATWHKAISATLEDEWDSAEDDEAFADLQQLSRTGSISKRRT